jgi:hypothetical protein
VFNILGASGELCPGAQYNHYDIAVEGTNDYYYVFTGGNNDCTTQGSPTGNTLAGGVGFIDHGHGSFRGGGIVNEVFNVENAAFLLATFSSTQNSSDTVTAAQALPGSSCFVQPTNSTAAGMLTGTYVSAVNFGQVTVTHPATAGGGFQVWCNF